MNGPTLRIVLADDHPVVREGLAAMLDGQPDFDVVGEAADGATAARLVRDLQPDVLLTDLRMPGVDGVALTAEVTRTTPATRVLVLTTYDSDTDIVRAVEAGATGYVLKDTPSAQLFDAIRATARGETVLAPTVAAKLVTRLRSPAADALTRREVEVLDQVAIGRTNAEIGRVLFIGEATVKTHLLRVFAKLGVDDRTAAVTVAIQRGIIATPGPQPLSRDAPVSG
jgi:DNA-binding NarL/FixJ family response regulator